MNNTDMNEFWNGDGGRNWLRFQNGICTGLDPFGQEAMSVASIEKGNRVLDIGCGSGDTSFEIAHLVGSRGYTQGIDISDLILRQTLNRQSQLKQNNISFECADAQSHRFEPKSFDLAYSRFGVMFFDEPVAAFRNIRQALITGGRLAFICWQSIKDNPWVNIPLGVVEKHVPLPQQPSAEEPGAFSFADPKRVTRILTSAGFTNVSIKRFEALFLVGASLDEAVTFLTHIGPASAAIDAPNIDEKTRMRITTDLRDVLVPHITENGVQLRAVTWIVSAHNT